MKVTTLQKHSPREFIVPRISCKSYNHVIVQRFLAQSGLQVSDILVLQGYEPRVTPMSEALLFIWHLSSPQF